MRALFAAIAVVLVSGAAQAQDIVSEHADATSVTLYHADGISTSDLLHAGANSYIRSLGLAFITETRTVDLPAGPATIHFRGVTSTMVPQTADIQGLPTGMVERNFDYDLLSPGSLLAKSIGKTVQLVRKDPKTSKDIAQTAIVRSGPQGAVLEIDGKFEALHCSGLPEKIVFDNLPEGLSDTPTLSVRTLAPSAGRYTVTLSYIATGLNWSADYIAHIRPDGRGLDLTGWLTLANFSDTGFAHVPLAVVAGRLNTTGDDTPVDAAPVVLATNCWPTDISWAKQIPIAVSAFAGADKSMPPPPPPPAPMNAVAQQEFKIIEARALGDYKIYTLPEPATMNARQTKQIQFLNQPDVTFEKVYRYRNGADARSADVLIRLDNKAETGLGKPLPAGSISVMEHGPDSGLVFAGQAAIGDTAVGLPMEIETGRAMDVAVVHRLTQSVKSGSGKTMRRADTFEITVENGKPIPVAFELQQYLYDGARITDESRPHIVKAGNAVWPVTLGAGARVTLTFTLDTPSPS